MTIMNISKMILAAFFCVLPLLAYTAPQFDVKQSTIPTEERRQQAILGVREFRCSYTLPNAPEYLQVIVESYKFGRLSRRYRAAHAGNFGRTNGTVSLAWLPKQREMVTIIENGEVYSPFSKRLLIDRSEFDDVFDGNHGFKVVEEREGMIPLMGISGQRGNKIGSGFRTPEEFLEVCKRANAKFCWIVYLHIDDKDNSGGHPRFEDGR